MKFSNPYLTTVAKIEMLQNWIVVHSILYYIFDTNIVPDYMYDMNGRQLAELMKRYPKSAKQTRFAYAFEGYEGHTGFNLYEKLNKRDREYLSRRAESLLSMMKRR